MMTMVKKRMDAVIGDITEQYLQKFASVSGADKTFGLRDKDAKFYVGKKGSKYKGKRYNC